MGLTVSSLFNRLFGKQSMRILMGKAALNDRYLKKLIQIAFKKIIQIADEHPKRGYVNFPLNLASYIQIYQVIIDSKVWLLITNHS